MISTSSKILKNLIIMSILAFGLFFVGANNSAAQTKTIAGEWESAMNTPGGVRTSKIIFNVDGEKLTGTVKRSQGDSPLAGTIKGNDIQFSYTISYNGNNLTMTVVGKVDGDSINGTVSFGESGQDAEWSAKRLETKTSAQ